LRAILTYHSVDDSGSIISTDREAFRRQVDWLAAGAVEVVSIEDLLSVPDEDDAVALTFDDGFANFASVAAPILEEAGLPATVFVVTDYVGGASSWPNSVTQPVPVLPLLDWPDLALLHERGVEIGAHSRSHPRLAALSRAELADEIGGSAERLGAELGVYPRSFCYPYGSVNAAAKEAVAEVFPLACTTELGLLDACSDVYLLPRLDMYYFRDRGRLESWGTPAFDRYLALRRAARKLRVSVRRAMGSDD